MRAASGTPFTSGVVMKKIKLRMEALAVESFDVKAEPGVRGGTVLAHASLLATRCFTVCVASCGYTCSGFCTDGGPQICTDGYVC
jgi:hypothetical protein